MNDPQVQINNIQINKVQTNEDKFGSGLLAQNDGHGSHGGDTQGHSNTDQHATNDSHGSQNGHEAEASPFTKLLSSLGDHRELTFGHYKICDLPVWIYDKGFHFYPSVEKMSEAGEFVYEHHHIYKAGSVQHDKATGKTTGTSPAFDFSPTSLIVYQWISIALLAALFIPMGLSYKKSGLKPKKGFFNMLEALVVYVRDEVARPNLGKRGETMVPWFLNMFFFILAMNFIGMLPGGHAATGSVNVTAGLAIIAFFTTQYGAISRNGIGAWFHHLLGGAPAWLAPLMVPVEILGLFTKPFALCMRLFANMTAGHVILLSLIGLVYVTNAFIPVTLGFSLFINILELMVAFLQAYIFTTLMAVFTGMGMEEHHHEEGHENGHDSHSKPNHQLNGNDHAGDAADIFEPGVQLAKH